MDANQQKTEEDRQIKAIKDRMPKVYAAIKAKSLEIGNEAFALVRRSIRGEAGCFYACEGDAKVGTYWPATLPGDVEQLVERFGLTFVCLWPESAVASHPQTDPAGLEVQRTERTRAAVSRRNTEWRAFIDGVHADDRSRGGPQMRESGASDGAN